MRNLKFISLMMGCLAAVCLTFTSCNDDDDDNKGLTPEQVETAFNAVRGDYNGIMLYAHKDSNGKQVNDSTNIAWSIQTDSVMTIYNFPVASLAKNVTDSTVSKAIATAKPQNLKCYIGFINMSPVTFLINPISVEFTANYGGNDAQDSGSVLRQQLLFVRTAYQRSDRYADYRSRHLQRWCPHFLPLRCCSLRLLCSQEVMSGNTA